MQFAAIDFESRSSVDLKRAGVYRYAQHESTDIWCMAYAFGDGPVQVWTPDQPFPADLADWVKAGKPLRAHNAQFERIVWREVLGKRRGLPTPTLEQWWCTAACVAAAALPRRLEEAAGVLDLPVKKDMDGYRLMMRMARPRKPRKGERQGTLLWWDEPEKVARLIEYCKTDVEVERLVAAAVRPLSEVERLVYLMDQRINDRGVMLDLPLVRAAKRLVDAAALDYDAELKDLTGDPAMKVTSVGALTTWLRDRGFAAESLDKQSVRDMLASVPTDETVRRVLEIRQEAGKSSNAKVEAMLDAVCSDGFIRGMLMYHAASTGRWAGRLVQPQNFPKGTLNYDLEGACKDILSGDRALIEALHGPVLETVSSCLRSMLIAEPGKDLVAADFAAIEARVLAWLADEQWLVKAFANNEPVYETMASHIFQKPVVKSMKTERDLGKRAILGCGYGMGVDKFIDTCAKEGSPISRDLAERAVRGYREKNVRIKNYWYALDRAAVNAVLEPGKRFYAGRIAFYCTGSWLYMVLPSGRELSYYKPMTRVEMTPWDTEQTVVSYMTVDSLTKQWQRRKGYGGLWAENATQAVARDLLVHAMARAERAGYEVRLTVHDEVVATIPSDWPEDALPDFVGTLTRTPKWAEGCPVAAEGWRGKRYKK